MACRSRSAPVTVTNFVVRSTPRAPTPASLPTSPLTAASQWLQLMPGTSRISSIGRSSRSQKAFDGPRRFVDEVLGAFAVATGGRAGDAMVQVLVEQFDADALQGLADRGDLGQHIDAVRVVLDHPRQAADLPFDAAEPGEELLLVVGVSGKVVHAFTLSTISWYP